MFAFQTSTSGNSSRWTVKLCLALAALVVFGPPLAVAADGPTFTKIVIDESMAGDCKSVGDLDGDGDLDLVVGGMPHEGLNWYRNPDWERTYIATPIREFTTDCGIADIDGDGDQDIVAPDGKSAGNLGWFENDLDGEREWPRHEVGTIGNTGKDIETGDVDADGRQDIVTRSKQELMIFFQDRPGEWSQMVFSGVPIGEEGLTSGDLDDDGDLDLVVRGAWLENPGSSAARSEEDWPRHAIGEAPEEFKAIVADVDGDGIKDVIYTSSESTADVTWWGAKNSDPQGERVPHVVIEHLEEAHTLQAADMDGDGDNDLVVGQMHSSDEMELRVVENLDGTGTSWRVWTIDGDGTHNGVVADVNGDGRPDIYGANWTGHPPLRLWLQTP